MYKYVNNLKNGETDVDFNPSDSFSSSNSSMLSSSSVSNSSSSSMSHSDEYTADELKSMLSKLYNNYNITNNLDTHTQLKKCPHKNTKCEFISPCCGMKFKCSKCHNMHFECHKIKNNIHCIDMTKINNIVCDICETIQPISNKCITCNITFSTYYCDVCKVFGDTKNNFHCDKCKFCVVGNKNDFAHCDKCECCIEKRIIKTHKCVPDRLNALCTICMDSLKNGDSVFLMKCGHTIHNQCYDAHIKTSYKCPECSKTIKDMTTEFKYLDCRINNEPMMSQKSVNIVCNDCNKKSITKYHYVGLKCIECNSYNTYKI